MGERRAIISQLRLHQIVKHWTLVEVSTVDELQLEYDSFRQHAFRQHTFYDIDVEPSVIGNVDTDTFYRFADYDTCIFPSLHAYCAHVA